MLNNHYSQKVFLIAEGFNSWDPRIPEESMLGVSEALEVNVHNFVHSFCELL